MIGNETNASIVANLPLVWSDYHFGYIVAPEDMPEGWTLLGEGCYRIAFLGPDGVVYKRETDGHSCNRGEALIYSTWKDQTPERVRLAECFLYDKDILAMEYVSHEWDADWENYNSLVDALADFMVLNFDYRDVRNKDGENWHIVGDSIVITDYSY